ncbi:MAG: glycosyltransferase, partial [Verrucomicrobia bacterium]|nr:glycosyltransferase [Verrucomicrobiota bacterium]
MILSGILGGLAALSLTLLLWQWFLGARFPLHVRTACPPAPAISILKPLKGRDDTTAASLESWMTQHYAGPLQILFGIADGQDPVRPVVEEWLRRHPNCDAQLIVCPERPGINGKMATAAQLEKSARHDLLLVSDADTRVPADFLANMAAPLRDANVALVNCFYRLANPATAAMQ